MLQRTVYPDYQEQLGDLADTLDEMGITVYPVREDGRVISVSFQVQDETVVLDVDPEVLRDWGVDPDGPEIERMWRE